MIEPIEVNGELWWVPAKRRSSMCARAIAGQSYRDALESKVDDLVTRAVEEGNEPVARAVADHLAPFVDLSIDETNPMVISAVLMNHTLVQEMVTDALDGPSASLEKAKEAVDEQVDMSFWGFLEDVPVSGIRRE